MPREQQTRGPCPRTIKSFDIISREQSNNRSGREQEQEDSKRCRNGPETLQEHMA